MPNPSMAGVSFASRRRRARSSPLVPLILSSTLIILLLIAWDSGQSFASSPPLTSLTPEATPRSVDDDAGIMTQLPLNNDDGPSSPSVPVGIEKQEATMPLRIVSYNIRYATKTPVLGERPWDVRCPKLCTQLQFITAGHESPFVCLQEGLYQQVQDIQAHLGSSWSHIGRGRGKEPTDGEFSPIFFRSDIWHCEHHETRWLSKTPRVPSIGWDAVLNRIVTMGLFRHKKTGTRVVVMSTHFDHIGAKARKHSAELLIQFAKEWARHSHIKPTVVLIGGDFNSTPKDDAYKVMTAPGSGMSDISSLVPVEKQYGNHLTYTSFGEPGESPMRIDFIFIQEPRTAIVKTSGVLANTFDDHILISDHRPVVADVNIVP